MKLVFFLFLFLFLQFSLLTLTGQESIQMFESIKGSEDLRDENLYLPYKNLGSVEFNHKMFDEESYRIGDKLLIELFDNDSNLATIDRVSRNVNGTLSIRARFDDYPMGYLILSETDNLVTASIRLTEKNERYRIKTDTESGYTYLKHLDISQLSFIESEPPLIPDDYPQMDERQLKRLKEAVEKSSKDVANVDVMIVYTPAAAMWANSNEGSILNTIAQSMEKAQLVLDNSEIGMTVTLVNSALVDYEEVGDNSSVDLIRLTASPDFNPWGNTWNGYQIPGYMDEVHDWRELYGADLVALFANVSDVGGLAWLLTSKSGMPAYGFSLTRVQQASGGYTHIHEMGHNMGCHHHKEQNYSPGPTIWSDWPENLWSAGWRWMGDDDQMYCNVMTYTSGQFFEDGIDAEQVPYFSNPDIEYMGEAAGHPEDGDNARTLREIKHVIAAYKEETDPEIYTLDLSANPEEYGIVMGEGNYAKGATVNITAVANYGFIFENWTDKDGIEISSEANFQYEMPGNDVKLIANFRSEAFIVTFSVQDQFNDPVQDAKINISSKDINKDYRLTTNISDKPGYRSSFTSGSSEAVHYMPSSQKKSNPVPFISRTREGGDWIHWDSGENVTAIGMGGAAVFDIASRWEPPEIAEYHGMQITKISFFPNYEACDYRLVIWVGEDAIPAYFQDVDDIVVGEWNVVELDSPFIIDGTDVLWFGVNFDTEDGFPAGCDGGPAIAGKGDLIRIGHDWVSMFKEYDLDYNWNLQAFVEEFVLYTDVNGYASFEAKKGEYTYMVVKEGYKTYLGEVEVIDQDISLEITLEEGDDPECVVTFNVMDVDDNPIEGATVIFDEENYKTDNEGKAVITDVEVGFYYYSVTKEGYLSVEDIVGVNKENFTVNVTLHPEKFILTLNIEPEEGGNVYGDGEYEEGEEVTITAEANENENIYKFVNWTGDTDNVDDPGSETTTVIMPAYDIELTANFRDVTTVEKLTAADISIFPNPASDKFTVESSEPVKQIRLLNISGQVIKDMAVDALHTEINVHNLQTGVYFVQIHTANSMITERVQVVR